MIFNLPHYFLTVIKQVNGGYLLKPTAGTYEVIVKLIISNSTGQSQQFEILPTCIRTISTVYKIGHLNDT